MGKNIRLATKREIEYGEARYEDSHILLNDEAKEIVPEELTLQPVVGLFDVKILENTDQAMARVLEDVVNLLVEQGTIRFTDLPNAAQNKLLSRRELRDQHQGAYLLGDEENLNI